MAEQTYKVREVAEMLRVSRPTVLKMLREGKLRSVRISPQVIRIPRDALDRYLAGREPDGGDVA